MDIDEYESLPTNNFSVHMSAGAIAGVMEHCVMYPLDSVKTRMQSLSPQVNYRGVMEALNTMIQQEGILRPVRGMGAVVFGAGPAHALYFSCYEFLKEKISTNTSQPFYIAAGASGVIATLLHDGIMTPAEVVKQRLQMFGSPYNSLFECVKKTYQSEGIRAFYRSYTTQLTMNVPFQSIHFIIYEFCQNVTNKERKYNPAAHMASGAIAGAIAAAVTTPLDVCKTLLNTQQHRVGGMVEAFKTVYRVGGSAGYFRGLQARVLYQMPSTAICWSMYEFFKFLLTPEVEGGKGTASTSMLKQETDITLTPGLLLVVPKVNLLADRLYQVQENSKDIFEYKDRWDNNIPRTMDAKTPGNAKEEDDLPGNVKMPSRNEWATLKSTSVASNTFIGSYNFNTMHTDDDMRQIYDVKHS